MLRFWRTYRSAILVWIFCGISFLIGLTVLNSVYVNVCEAAKAGEADKCEPYPAVIAAFYKIVEIISHAETWTALATIAIAAFTWTLKRSADKLWGETRSAAERQERDIRTLQRAFVHVESISSVILGDNIKITPFWENSGTTPTRNLRINTNWREGYNIPGEHFDYSYITDEIRIFLGPKSTNGAGEINIPLSLVNKILGGRSEVIIWGRADYQDIFEGTSPHFVEFCVALKVEFQAGVKGFAFSTPYIGPHNRSDEDTRG